MKRAATLLILAALLVPLVRATAAEDAIAPADATAPAAPAAAAPAATPAAAPDAPAAPVDVEVDEADDDVAEEHSLQELFKVITDALKAKGETRDDVLTVTIPRDDLNVMIEGMDVPTAAGIASEFKFYQCPCGGKISVIGQFVTPDYEANDVVDELRKGNLLVASVGPFLTYESPRLTLVRFQGEAKAEDLAATLKKALEWTGEKRMAPVRKLDE